MSNFQIILNIITHHRLNVNIFTKSLCPILTAAEGIVLGLCANLLKIAGPVIVYGTVARVVWGYLLDNNIILTKKAYQMASLFL